MWTEKYILSWVEQGSAADLEGTRVGWNYDYSDLISCNIPPYPILQRHSICAPGSHTEFFFYVGFWEGSFLPLECPSLYALPEFCLLPTHLPKISLDSTDFKKVSLTIFLPCLDSETLHSSWYGEFSISVHPESPRVICKSTEGTKP